MTPYEILNGRSIKIRLDVDLTSYHPELKQGTIGTTKFDPSTWGCWCYFEKAGRWDIIMTGVTIVDPEYLEAKAKEDAELSTARTKATNVILELGPQGGFRCLRYTTDKRSELVCDRIEAYKIIDEFTKNGIKIKEDIARRGQ